MLTTERIDQLGYYALTLCVIKGWSPEAAFTYLAPKAKPVSPEIEDMIRMRNEGATYKQIGEKYGMSIYSVIRRIKNTTKKRDIADETQHMVELRKAGTQLKDIAEIYGLSVCTVHKRLKKAEKHDYFSR